MGMRELGLGWCVGRGAWGVGRRRSVAGDCVQRGWVWGVWGIRRKVRTSMRGLGRGAWVVGSEVSGTLVAGLGRWCLVRGA